MGRTSRQKKLRGISRRLLEDVAAKLRPNSVGLGITARYRSGPPVFQCCWRQDTDERRSRVQSPDSRRWSVSTGSRETKPAAAGRTRQWQAVQKPKP